MDGSPDVSLPFELQSLSNLLEEFPETLALGNQDLQATALNATKYAFDLSIQSEASSKSHVVELMSSLSWSLAPQTRSKANREETEKPNPQFSDKNLFDFTPLNSLYIDGMDEEQIWEQLDLRTKTICRVLDFVLEGELEEDGDENDEEMRWSDENEESEEDEEDDDENEENPKLGGRQTIEPLKHDLFAEDEKVQGELEEDVDSQDEEMEWGAGNGEMEEEEEEDDKNEENPRLGSRRIIERPKHVLFAEEKEEFEGGLEEVGDSQDEEMEWGDENEEWGDENEEMEDNEEEEEEEEEGDDDDKNEEDLRLDSRQTIERLKHDLFDEEEEEDQDDLTTHEKRMATLRDQIVELESENVAQKDWVLMGEAGSRQRPQNSLLEEDLEFDRVMKAVPVITEEAVHSLEETIKTRILEGRFDDVIRMRPLDDKPFLPSKFFELQDSKSTQSLAQIYENDYISAQSGVSADDRDGRLKKEHDEISQVWDNICGKLDALCNAHFVPKQPKAIISTVTNVATATLESALPTSKSTATMLAPEEIFATSSSLQRAQSELTPVEKRALRTRERKARQRQRNALDKSVDKYSKTSRLGSVKRQKEAALRSVVKHGKGVTVVGKQFAKDKKAKA